MIQTHSVKSHFLVRCSGLWKKQPWIAFHHGYTATNLTDRSLDTITVMAFVFKADGTLKARQTAPGRRNLDARETKYSTLVLDGSNVEPSDVVVIGINQTQHVGSNEWWRADLQPAAEAAVPLKKP